jgi:hypothetical protein
MESNLKENIREVIMLENNHHELVGSAGGK